MTLLKKTNNELDAFEEEFHEIKGNLESLKEKCKSANNTILTNPVPTQTNNRTLLTHTDSPNKSTIVSQISQSINESIKKANKIFVFDLKEQSNKSDKNTKMNLCKFVVDHVINPHT